MRPIPTEFTHHATIPDMMNGEPNTTITRRSCKMSDPTDAESLERGEVTCPKCLDSLKRADQYAWQQADAQRIADYLDEFTIGREQEEGYGHWHERAGSVCMAVTERLHLIGTPDHLPVAWYLKITPVHPDYRNHGYHLKVCYGLDGDVVHAAAEDWVPAEWGGDPYAMHSRIQRTMADVSRAILFGVRMAQGGKLAQREAVSA